MRRRIPSAASHLTLARRALSPADRLARAAGDAGRRPAVASGTRPPADPGPHAHSRSALRSAPLHIVAPASSRRAGGGVRGVGEEDAAGVLEALRAEYADGRRGLVLKEVAGGLTFAVAPDCEDDVRRLTGARAPGRPHAGPARDARRGGLPAAGDARRRGRGARRVLGVGPHLARGARPRASSRAAPTLPARRSCTGPASAFSSCSASTPPTALPPLEEFALQASDVEEIRARLFANAERRRV